MHTVFQIGLLAFLIASKIIFYVSLPVKTFFHCGIPLRKLMFFVLSVLKIFRMGSEKFQSNGQGKKYNRLAITWFGWCFFLSVNYSYKNAGSRYLELLFNEVIVFLSYA